MDLATLNYWPTRVNTWTLTKLTTRMYFNIFIIVSRIILPLTPMRSLRSDPLLSAAPWGEEAQWEVLCSAPWPPMRRRIGMSQSCTKKSSDWPLGKIYLLWEWSNSGTSLDWGGCYPTAACVQHLDNALSNTLISGSPWRGQAVGLDYLWRPLLAVLFFSVLFYSVRQNVIYTEQ